MIDRAHSNGERREYLASSIHALYEDLERLYRVGGHTHSEPYFVQSGCCAFKEIDNLATAPEPLEALRKLFPNDASRYDIPAFAFFSQSRLKSDSFDWFYTHGEKSNRPYGKEFADFLTSKELGKVIELGEQTNTRTGRLVTGWIWTPDKEKLKAFLAELDKQDVKARRAWSGQIEAARRESDQSRQVAGPETVQPSGENGSGVRRGLEQTPTGNPAGA
jgi:hypothetical protein